MNRTTTGATLIAVAALVAHGASADAAEAAPPLEEPTQSQSATSHVEVLDGGTAELPPGTDSLSLTLPGRAERDALGGFTRVEDTSTLRDYNGEPDLAPLAPALPASSSRGCFGAPPQQYRLWPLRGCSLAPPSAGWAHELCFGSGIYLCREIWGHPQLNLDPNANYVVYKSNTAHYSPYRGPGAAWYDEYGMEAVDRAHGWLFEGCYQWAKIIYGDGSSDFWTTCDYKQGRNGPLPLLAGTARDHFYDTLRHWSGNMYDNEFNCAATITGTWTGAADTNDVVPACLGIFAY